MFKESTWTENARSFVSLSLLRRIELLSRNTAALTGTGWVSFCAVTVCLEEGDLTSDRNLVVTQFDSEILDCERNDHIVVKIAKVVLSPQKKKFHVHLVLVLSQKAT